MMGSAAHPERWGETGLPIEGKRTVGGSWTTRTLTYYDKADCGHYVTDTHTDEIFKTYDDRN
jgi:hypothetical protein